MVPRQKGEAERPRLGPIPLIEFGDVGSLFAGPITYALEHGPKRTRPLAGVFGGIGSSPYMIGRHPKAATEDIGEMVRGAVEAIPATKRSIEEVGWRDTAGLMMDSVVLDYKTRYGEDWREHAKKDPLFNFLDATAVFGAGFRTAALGNAFQRLGRAGVKRTPKTVWQESTRPGWLSEGAARERRLQYELPTGGVAESFQPYSRSATRRIAQDVADALAERYPNAPMIGAAVRIPRAASRGQARDLERQLSQGADPHAVQALSEPLRTRLFWGAQIGDHSTQALKELRDLLDESLRGGELPDDPGFRQVVQEARKRGFGKQMIARFDKALKVEPDARYERAIESMRDMTAVSEQTIRDANGFAGLAGDLKRARDRLRGLDPDLADEVEASTLDELEALREGLPEEMRRPVAEVLDVRRALSQQDARLSEMFRSRRNRVRDWRNQARLAKSAIRTARLEELTGLFGEEQAQYGIRVADRIANALDPENPERYYEERVGMPTGEVPEEVVARLGMEPDWQRQMVLEAAAEGGAKGTIYYSPLQRYVQDAMPRRVQAKQLPGLLRKQTSRDELDESGVLDWIESLPPEQMVTKQEVLNYFANPANAYGIEEISLSGFSQLYPLKYEGHRGLWSNEGPARERRQIIFRAPGKQRYTGAGQGHWEMDNVIAHIRFREVEVNGKRTMIVEEIQSDWLDDWLEGKKYLSEALKTVNDPDAYLALLQRWRQEYPVVTGAWHRARQELEDIDAEDFAAKQEEVAYLHDRIYDWEQEMYREADRLGADPDMLIEDARQNVPRSPLSEEAFIRMGVRRLLRHAAEKGFEEIIVPSGNVHRYRYAGSKHKAGNMRPRDVTARLAAEFGDSQQTHKFNRLYDYGRKDSIPTRFAKELGQEGEYSDEAFPGRYAHEMPSDANASKKGGMPGTVFRLTEADREKHRQPAAAFQRQPDFSGVPKGANELLADNGRNLIHMFSRADISTWIHELGHSALYDLAGEDRRLIEEHFAAGNRIEDWTAAERENFARTWEQYVRNGEAPTPELRSTFQKLGEWMRAIWEAAQAENIPLDPKVRAVFDRFLQGDPSQDVDIFVPHRATAPELSGARTSKGVPRARQEIGDRAFSRIPIFARNRLALMQMGMLNDDPRMSVEHMNRIVMLARANQIRETVMELATPLMPDEIPDFQTQYVVKKAGRGVNRPLYDAIEAADDPAEIRDSIKTFVDEYITDNRERWQEWQGKDQLYVVDKDYIDRLFKNVTGKTPGATTRPETGVTKLTDAALDAVRAALLYANPGFYTANLLGNAAMLGLSDPRAFRFLVPSMREAMRAARKPDTADQQWRRISTEMGRGPTTGGLSTRPPLLGREAGRAGAFPVRAAETASLAIGGYGRRTGRVIDDAMRVAAWKQVASKLGYTSRREIDKLLDDASGGELREGGKRPSPEETRSAKQDLAQIRDEAEQLMLDFDSMTPFEKSLLTRIIFLYPFIKASAKWPFMFVGERPITAGALAAYGGMGEEMTEQQLGPRPELPLWLSDAARVGPGQYFAAGQIAPMAPIAGLAESVLGLGQTPATGIRRPIDYLNPLPQLAIELAQGRSQFGQDLPAQQILRQDFPMTAFQRQALGLRGPSEIYADRSLLGTALRSLRLLPYGINEPAAAEAASAPPPPPPSRERRSKRRSKRRG